MTETKRRVGKLLPADVLPTNEVIGSQVFCLACMSWCLPDENWICDRCGSAAFYGSGPGRCDECGNRCHGMRFGHVWEKICPCKMSADQIREREAAMAQREADEAEQAKKERAIEVKRTQADREKEAAADCWDHKRHECSVEFAKPANTFCRQCAKFKRGGGQ